MFGGEEAGEGDHSGVVGGESRGRELEGEVVLFAGGAEGILQGPVAGNAAGDGDDFVTGVSGGAKGLFDEAVDDGGLEGGADVGELGPGVVEFLELVEDGGFEAGEGEIVGLFLESGAGEGEGFGVSGAGVLFDFGASGVGELEHAADFIEGFAGGVIDGASEEFVGAEAPDIDEHGVAAGDDESEVRGDVAFFEEGREEVAFHVVDAKEGLAGRGGERFGVGKSYEKGGGKAGAAGGGEGGDVVDGDSGIGEGLFDEGADALGVVAAGDLGDDAAVGAVDVDLGRDEGGEEAWAIVAAADDGHGGFIARGFDGEEHGGRVEDSR